MKTFISFIRSITLIPLLFAVVFCSSAFADQANKNIAAPDQKGPYNIGFVLIQDQYANNGTTNGNLLIWYPTNSTIPYNYTNNVYPDFVFTPSLGFKYKSLNNAVENAPIASGQFPLIIQGHGGIGGVFNSYSNIETHTPVSEILASHGFIVVAYQRSAACSNTVFNQVFDPRIIIDHMLAKTMNSLSPFYNHIDPNKIGAIGYSGSGGRMIALGTGDSTANLAPDTRVKGIVLYEPITPVGVPLLQCGVTSADFQNMTVPFLLMQGSLASVAQIPGATVESLGQDFFNNLAINSVPRFYVHISDEATGSRPQHFSFGSESCYAPNDLREASLVRQLAYPWNIVEPLTSTNITLPSSVDGGLGVASAGLWSGSPTGTPSKFCNKVGINSTILNLDNDHDGLTDSPPFIATNPSTISGDRIEELEKIYTISFLKVFVAGDNSYNRFLTPGYTNRSPDVSVIKVGD
jgi:hypothetical protein